MTFFRRFFTAVALVFCATGTGFAADNSPKIPPTSADVAYGPDPMQKLDVYVPTKGKGPFPILFWIHGGGWFAGDKRKDAGNVVPFLDHGAAVVSINYRMTQDARKQNIIPVEAITADNRRALQYVRLHAADWNLNPNIIVTGGGSAGALSSLYLACEGEQANPQSADPVERVSTKITAAEMENAQASMDPETIHEWVPGCAYAYWFFQMTGPTYFNDLGLPPFNQFLADRAKYLDEIKKYSPEYLITKDTPPLYFAFGQKLPAPDTKPWPHSDELVHCPLWGVAFQKVAQQAGVPCYLQYPGHPPEKYKGEGDFAFQELGIK